MEPVLKTGVPSAQPPSAEALAGNTPADLGAFLGALAELAPNSHDSAAVTEFADLLAAWSALPEPVKAGILAMIRAVSSAERPG